MIDREFNKKRPYCKITILEGDPSADAEKNPGKYNLVRVIDL